MISLPLSLYQQVLDQSSSATLLCDDMGEVIFINPRAHLALRALGVGELTQINELFQRHEISLHEPHELLDPGLVKTSSDRTSHHPRLLSHALLLNHILKSGARAVELKVGDHYIARASLLTTQAERDGASQTGALNAQAEPIKDEQLAAAPPHKETVLLFELTKRPLTAQEAAPHALNTESAVALNALEQLNQELRRASQAKDDFLASMSHELRTPLNAILGLSEALLEEIYGPLQPEQVHSVKLIEQSGAHLLALISDILDISKIRAGGLHLKVTELDVEAVCSAVVQQLKSELKRKRLSLSLEVASDVYAVRADERCFRQLLMNLMSNAIKFTPEGRQVGLKVTGDREAKLMRVTVWDQGIGIKPEDMPKLFQSFMQLDTSLSRAYEGTGLGLSIVASLMELHQGRAWAESVYGEGSSFHLEFPWDPQLQAPTTLTLSEASLEQILLVEDSEVDAERVTRYLKELGAEVSLDPTGAQALTLAEEAHPQLILLDLHLPELTGRHLLNALRHNPKTAETPIVVCSVLDPSEARIPLDLVQGYLVKPVSRQALFREIARALKPSEAPQGAATSQTSAHVSESLSAEATPVSTALVVQPHEPKEAQKRVLIVDDQPSNIRLLQDYLTRKGYSILSAENGYQAVQISRALNPDLILMDVQMPHMDGIEATRLLKSDPQTRSIPIFAVTALAMAGDQERCLAAGMEQYFTKPVSLRSLVKSIEARLS